ncbi:hypothetical protein [Candidatus Phytoplasma fraxini]|uniref:Integral membrane protein n=1 Tax=Ash yellows phytoplasma TaxID=35780 RepID=A0ABZ2U9V2_ASHYP
MCKSKSVLLTRIFFIISLIILFLGIRKGILTKQPFFSLHLFTRQTIFLSTIFLFLNFIQITKNQKISYLGFICFINNVLMAILYLKIEDKTAYQQITKFNLFVSILEHKFFPLIFGFHYLCIDKNIIEFKKFYISLFYPFIYFCFVFILVNFFGFTEPYQFFNSQQFFYIFVIIVVFLILLSLFIIFLKKYIFHVRVYSKISNN